MSKESKDVLRACDDRLLLVSKFKKTLVLAKYIENY